MLPVDCGSQPIRNHSPNVFAGFTIRTIPQLMNPMNPLVTEPEEAAPRLSGFIVPTPVNIPDAPEEIPVTAFRDYLQCPYRYFLQRELRLRSVEDDVRELTATAFGKPDA